MIAARGMDGDIRGLRSAGEYPRAPHPAPLDRAGAALAATQCDEAKAIAKKIADALDYVGVLAVELFVTKDGALLVNEIAPRVHNSGHWTIEACAVSQFEQHIRAVAGWPLGDPARHSDAVMENIIGEEAADWQALAASGGALHLYGKTEIRAGRKMGHITYLKPKTRRRAEAFAEDHRSKRRQVLCALCASRALNFSNCITSSMRAVEEFVVSRFVFAFIGEPAHQRGRIHARQDRALGVEIEIGGGVARRAPHRDRPCDRAASRPVAACGGKREKRRRAARGFLVRRRRIDARPAPRS